MNEDFNLSTAESTSVIELTELIWRKIHPNKPLSITCEKGFEHDVNKRIPSVRKASEILGFNAETSLNEMLDEVIPWISNAIALDQI